MIKVPNCNLTHTYQRHVCALISSKTHFICWQIIWLNLSITVCKFQNLALYIHRDTNASGVIFGLTYIFQHCLHDLPEFVPVSIVHPSAPHASQNLCAVRGVVPHHMEGQLLGISQPLGHGSRLSAGQSTVQVPADHRAHAGVNNWQESPQHPKY